MPRPNPTIECSFCGKNRDDVKKMVAGPKVFICDECVDICIEVFGKDKAWCDREIENIKRLRKQARHSPPTQEARATGGRGWLGRLFR